MRRTPADSITAGAERYRLISRGHGRLVFDPTVSERRLRTGARHRINTGYGPEHGSSSFSAFAHVPSLPLGAGTLYEHGRRFVGPSYMDIITIKQMRDAEVLTLAAFQSVVRSTMYLDRFYDFGWLCDPRARTPPVTSRS